MYLVYSVLMGLAAVLLTPYWLIQGIRHGKYLSNLKERLGLAFPARPLVVSTTTITGQALARERMPFADAVRGFAVDCC